ncbi:MAG: T9SS type A sorting domain-containing protein [Bacteroidetes bacterium]|nr:T9SS type A sorting domain-containing protein [Bacteroidota bacterium]
MKKGLLVVGLLLTSIMVHAQTAHQMSSGNYSVNFDDIASWTNTSGTFAVGSGSASWKGLASGGSATIPDATRLTAATTSFQTGSTGGVQRGTNNILLLSTGATDNSSSAAIDLFLDFTGRNAGTISFDAATVFNSTGNRVGTLRVYYTTNGTTYTELTGTNLPYSATNNVAGSASVSSVSLPSAFNNSATAQLRFYYHNGTGGSTGSRPKISIDNLVVTSTASTPTVNLSVSANSGTEAAQTAITVTATASSAVSGNQTVDLAVSGTGITAGDYTLTNTTITILDGATTGTVTFTVQDDAAVEGSETATLTISNPSAGLVLGSTLSQDIAITDNDANLVNVSVDTNTGTEADQTVVTVTATATTAVSGSQTVDVAVSGTGITAGDYSLSGSQITIPDGNTTGSVTFTVQNDALYEGSETATLTISNPSSGIALGSTLSQNVAITDNEPTVQLSASSNTGTEAAGTVVTLTATASSAVTGDQTVDVAVSGTGITVSDYTLSASTLTILDGQTTGTVTFTILNDSDIEGAETATLTISNPSAGMGLGATVSQNVAITDNDVNAVNIAAVNSAVTQDFNTLATAGTTNSTLPTGWLFSETGTSANTTYAASDGTSNGGNTYSLGTGTDTDRAFGGLQSGSVIPVVGGAFINNTGVTVTELAISYTGEQWRLGATGRNDRLDFQYSTDATSLTTGTWTDVNELDFTAPIGTGTAGALNGNNSANRAAVTFTLTGLSIADGAVFYIRWNDLNATSSDDALGVDDFSLTANPVVNPTSGSYTDAGFSSPTTLTGGLNISGTLTIGAQINTDGNTINLGGTGSITGETPATYIIGAVQILPTINGAPLNNIGGLGVDINPGSANMGVTTIIRETGSAFIIGGSVAQRWTITPNSQPGEPVTVTLTWPDENNAGVDVDTNPILFRSQDGGTTWSPIPALSWNTAGNPNTVTFQVNSFSEFTIGDNDSPLPIELVSWQAIPGNQLVVLKWKTASEINNAGFEIYRSTSRDKNFINIASYRSNGKDALSSKGNRGGSYEFVDAGVSNGVTYYYRLSDVSYDGQKTDHAVIEAIPTAGSTGGSEYQKPIEFAVSSVYPNPFNPTGQFSFDLPEDGLVTIRVFNLIGQEMGVLRSEFMKKGRGYSQTISLGSISTGTYLLSVEHNGSRLMQKFTVLK